MLFISIRMSRTVAIEALMKGRSSKDVTTWGLVNIREGVGLNEAIITSADAEVA